VALLRAGHAFVDALGEFIHWDDRGQAFAIWRHLPELPKDVERLFFQFDYICEADLRGAMALLGDPGAAAERALDRRTDAWFPPQRRTLFLSDRLRLETRPAIVKALREPYKRAADGGHDYNLSGERLPALYEVISQDRWGKLCRSVRAASERIIRSDPSFGKACALAMARATAERDRRIAQLRQRLTYMTHAWGCAGGTEDAVEAEAELYAALIDGVGRPEVRLDAVGLIVLAGRRPCSDEVLG
jgi:ATP-dependent helicase HepA